ncbi:hypothetical protein AGLY_006225 [Aphis glycines]|uniref:Uncharacterized protein n=1 Tax=Aphis glycines TaxID=307491 RepID=A0A6G0TR06_APHGL|nr:hypothetical protein AGLY_006225 [Aphis glycines]
MYGQKYLRTLISVITTVYSIIGQLLTIEQNKYKIIINNSLDSFLAFERSKECINFTMMCVCFVFQKRSTSLYNISIHLDYINKGSLVVTIYKKKVDTTCNLQIRFKVPYFKDLSCCPDISFRDAKLSHINNNSDISHSTTNVVPDYFYILKIIKIKIFSNLFVLHCISDIEINYRSISIILKSQCHILSIILSQILTLRGSFFQISNNIVSFIYFLDASKHHFGTRYLIRKLVNLQDISTPYIS